MVLGQADASAPAGANPGPSTNHATGDTLVGHDAEDRVTMGDDWSQSGRGSHVDFDIHEKVPIEQGHFLGRGAAGDVHEVIIQGMKLAHKRVFSRKKIGDQEKKEIEVLKKISHRHTVQLVGTYTHHKILGILLYPVAICDLHTFFDDVESWTRHLRDRPASQFARGLLEARESFEETSKERLDALGYDFPKGTGEWAAQVYSRIGCLVSAVSYLHEHRIRHKDIKPSNILLSRDRIWLSDFGSATDFSQLSQSATNNERGTPRYFAPEMAAWRPCGRPADIFSLGCVLFEIFVLHQCGSLGQIRQDLSPDPSFHMNLDKLQNILLVIGDPSPIHYANFLIDDIRRMMNRDPNDRPRLRELQVSLSAADITQTHSGSISMFSACCPSLFMTRQEHQNEMTKSQKRQTALENEVKISKDRIEQFEEQVRRHDAEKREWLQEARTMYERYEAKISERVLDITSLTQSLPITHPMAIPISGAQRIELEVPDPFASTSLKTSSGAFTKLSEARLPASESDSSSWSSLPEHTKSPSAQYLMRYADVLKSETTHQPTSAEIQSLSGAFTKQSEALRPASVTYPSSWAPPGTSLRGHMKSPSSQTPNRWRAK